MHLAIRLGTFVLLKKVIIEVKGFLFLSFFFLLFFLLFLCEVCAQAVGVSLSRHSSNSKLKLLVFTRIRSRAQVLTLSAAVFHRRSTSTRAQTFCQRKNVREIRTSMGDKRYVLLGVVVNVC